MVTYAWCILSLCWEVDTLSETRLTGFHPFQHLPQTRASIRSFNPNPNPKERSKERWGLGCCPWEVSRSSLPSKRLIGRCVNVCLFRCVHYSRARNQRWINVTSQRRGCQHHQPMPTFTRGPRRVGSMIFNTDQSLFDT